MPMAKQGGIEPVRIGFTNITSRVHRFLAELNEQENLLTEFDEPLCRATLESITVYSEKDAAVKFKDGTEIHVDCSDK